MDDPFVRAYSTTDAEEFLSLLFPPSWAGVAARILESGVEMTGTMCPWAPRWSKVPPTVRRGTTHYETAVKSCLFRVHDFLHQLWGLPIPTAEFTEEDRLLFKRAGMCGEVAALTIEEFEFCNYVFETYPATRPILWRRNALPMRREGPLQGKSLVQIAVRLDGLLHQKLRPGWVLDSPPATAFADDYVPMLERDRVALDAHWESMRTTGWVPAAAPNSRYSRELDGLELTVWMIEDFYHLMNTDAHVDAALREFNRRRRETIVLPERWDG